MLPPLVINLRGSDDLKILSDHFSNFLVFVQFYVLESNRAAVKEFFPNLKQLVPYCFCDFHIGGFEVLKQPREIK